MGVNVVGASDWSRDLIAAAAKVEAGNAAVIRATGEELVSQIRSRAPRGETGDYAGSWKSEPESSPGVTSVHVYTEAEQGPRLEYGFHGTDSKGRTYDQAPQSHQRAGNDVVYPQIPAALRAVVDRALDG